MLRRGAGTRSVREGERARGVGIAGGRYEQRHARPARRSLWGACMRRACTAQCPLLYLGSTARALSPQNRCRDLEKAFWTAPPHPPTQVKRRPIR